MFYSQFLWNFSVSFTILNTLKTSLEYLKTVSFKQKLSGLHKYTKISLYLNWNIFIEKNSLDDKLINLFGWLWKLLHNTKILRLFLASWEASAILVWVPRTAIVTPLQLNAASGLLSAHNSLPRWMTVLVC